MVVYLRKSIHSLLSIFKKTGESCVALGIENVFIEGSRPQYLEDLHTEALEGLKILQEGQMEYFLVTVKEVITEECRYKQQEPSSTYTTRKVRCIEGWSNRNPRSICFIFLQFFSMTFKINTFQINFTLILNCDFSCCVQGPVMSISPQATYMSTIIPNAVLPAAVDVIEIDHGLSRARGSSVHTVSKSSLGSGDSPVSPVLSRRSDVDGSQNDTSLNSSSFACDSASESQSSKTIVLISSPASSKRSTCSVDSEHLVAGDASEMDTSQVEDKKLKRRSLSVTKTKQPPAPPRRTNSLHCNKIRNNAKVFVNCQEPVLENDVTVTTTVTLSTPGSVIENGGAHPKSDASFSNRDKMERTISPSSGYSSQSGTPTLSPKEFSPTSPEKQKKASVKPETSVSPSSPSSSLTSLSSGASEPANHDVPSKDSAAPPTLVSSALSTQIKSLINVPAHPKVRAPCPPPPEVWAHNRRTVELLLGSYGNVEASQFLDGTVTQVPKLSKNTPPATPPPTYHPTPPLTRKPTISTQDSVELQKVQEDGKVSESCWPPPPPPLEEAYEGGDETEFPLPPPPPPLPNSPSSVSFRRQPSTANRAKEFHARHKSVPIPKEDANIPLVTPSLLQMVRLSRPVASQTPQNTPQKPIRKSLSVKSSSPLPSPTVVQPSLRLQEAIRMKTAAMSSKESLLVRPVARLPPYNTKGVPGSDTHKSTASTASFIFARSDKKVVIETVEPSPEAQMSLKQNLAAELVHLSEQSKSNAYSNGGIKSVPPPVARKPSYGSVGPLQTLPGNVGIRHQIAPLETKSKSF
uniref:Uncharacterized protein n=1 Tax=Periophthalmus magnuspinnatus TaxID=409849 RepID=A0A3B4BJ73_9GOBI